MVESKSGVHLDKSTLPVQDGLKRPRIVLLELRVGIVTIWWQALDQRTHTTKAVPVAQAGMARAQQTAPPQTNTLWLR
jgi:hypothetical protein